MSMTDQWAAMFRVSTRPDPATPPTQVAFASVGLDAGMTVDDLFVFDDTGQRIGLSLLVDGERWVIQCVPAPAGSTSKAWPGG